MSYDPQYTIIPTQESIVARLEEQTIQGGIIRGVKVFRGQVTEGDRVPTDANGDIIPYIAIVFPLPGPAPASSKGIVSVDNDLQLWRFGVELYTNIEGELQDFAARVSYILRGWAPVGAGELDTLNSGQIENPAEVKQNHARIGFGLVFQCYVGTKTPELTVESDL